MTSAADRAPVADVRHAVPSARAAAGEPDRQLVEAVRTALAQAADPERAAGQQAYMKSAMPYRGLTAPVLSATLRPLFADPAHRVASRVGWDATVRALWDEASYREERYAAIALTGHPWYAAWQDPDTMPLFRHLITTGAWWDYVDQLASRRVGPILRAHPGTMASLLRDWARAEDHWLRRTAIIAQLGSRTQTDRELLLDCIEPSVDEPDFFLRKAIGWALRQHARVPGEDGWVRAVVDAYGDRLSPLSRKEALKHL